MTEFKHLFDLPVEYLGAKIFPTGNGCVVVAHPDHPPLIWDGEELKVLEGKVPDDFDFDGKR